MIVFPVNTSVPLCSRLAFGVYELDRNVITEKVVCYWGTWSVYRPGLGKFEVNNIDPNICTHVVYTFFGAKADGAVSYLDPYLDLPDAYGRGNPSPLAESYYCS